MSAKAARSAYAFHVVGAIMPTISTPMTSNSNGARNVPKSPGVGSYPEPQWGFASHCLLARTAAWRSFSPSWYYPLAGSRKTGAPATIRTCDLCLRRATHILRPNLGRSFRKPAVLIAQTLTSGSPPAGFPSLSPPNLRRHVFYPRRGQSGTLLCTGLVRRVGASAVLHELIRYCNAVPKKLRRHRGTKGDRLKNLK